MLRGEEQLKGEDFADADMAVCTKCNETTPMCDTLSAGRVGRICKLCYNSARACLNYYKKRGRKKEWGSMNAEKKRKMIVQNKGTGGRGKSRDLNLSEDVQDSAMYLRTNEHRNLF